MSAWGWSLRDLPWGSCNARIFSPKMSLKKQPGLSLARLHWQVDISDDNEVTEYMCEQFSTKTLFHQWPSCSVLHQLRHWIFTLTGPCRSLVLKAPIWYRHISAIAISWGLKHTKPPCLILKPTFFENSIAMTAHEASALNPRPHGGSLMPSSLAELSDLSFEMRSAQKLPTWLGPKAVRCACGS